MVDCIGILDSGVGGISVLQKAVELLPGENFLYYGDNANAPYGPRPLEEICALSAAAVDVLLDRGVKALVIACNTITSAYAGILRQNCPIPVIGMEPAIKPASLSRRDGAILALATRATLSQDKFAILMQRYGKGVIPVEGRGFVELVESGCADDAEITRVLKTVFEPYLAQKIDGIVLGCTHYPFLRRQIEALFPMAEIFDGRDGTVRQLERRLRDINALSQRPLGGQVEFMTSGNQETLALMKRLFRTKI